MAYRANNIGPASLLTDAEKIKLWEEHKAGNRSNAETAVIAKVSSGTISNWFKDLAERGLIKRTGQKRAKFEMKDKMEAVRLHVQDGCSIAEVAEMMSTSHQNIYKWVRDFGNLIPRVPAKQTPEEQAAELMRDHDELLGIREHKFRPVEMTDNEKQALLKQDLDTAALAKLAGVCEDTITRWRSEFGMPARRGIAPALSDEEKRELFARGQREGLKQKDLAEIAGVKPATISNWKKQLAELDAPVSMPEPEAHTPSAKLRKFSLTRPDGSKLEAELSFDEIRQLMAA